MDDTQTNTPAADTNATAQPVAEETKAEETKTEEQTSSVPETEQPAA
jgi:hypothetical protein